jgi:hypothetical protein
MSCRSCQSKNQRTYESEINVHFPELDNLKKPPVLAFSNLLICLDCGFVESTISDSELRELVERTRDIKSSG